MKYLKLFDAIDNDLYSVITKEEYDAVRKMTLSSDDEDSIELLLWDIYHKNRNKVKNMVTHNYGRTFKCSFIFSVDGRPDDFTAKRCSIDVIKNNDEYYYVQFDVTHDADRNYKCDQEGGLEKCIREISSEVLN